MMRKQIYISEETNEELQLVVRRGQAVSQADFIRQAVNEKIEAVKPKKIPVSEVMEQIRKLCKFKTRKSDKYLSRDIDKILYG